MSEWWFEFIVTTWATAGALLGLSMGFVWGPPDGTVTPQWARSIVATVFAWPLVAAYWACVGCWRFGCWLVSDLRQKARADESVSVVTDTKSLKAHEGDGFDAATNWLVESDGESGLFHEYFRPPIGTDGCDGCTSGRVVENDCPRCRYDLGFTEGASK